MFLANIGYANQHGGFGDPHNQGNFGPFQICYSVGISFCGGHWGGFQTRGKIDADVINKILIELCFFVI